MSAITDQSNVDMDILNRLFDDCDTIVTGQVRTNDVISMIKSQWTYPDNDRERTVQINDLNQRLDPRKDNCYLEREVFVKCGLAWLEDTRAKCNNNGTLSNSSLASTGSQVLDLSGIGEVDKKSLLFDPNATFGSIEGINGASLSAEKASIIELQEEIQELKKQTKNMFDDKTKIANQLNLSEDSNVILTSQNLDLQNRLKSLKTSLDNALNFQQEMDELKTIAKNKEEELNLVEQNHLKNSSRIVELTNENMDLQCRLDETTEQLNGAVGELQLAKKSHSVALETLREDNEDMKVKLNETMSVKVELENRIEELKSDLTNVRESQFFQQTPSIFDDVGESEFLSPSFDEEAFTRRFNDRAREDRGDEVDEPRANSTPFIKRLNGCTGVRGSISEEIKVLGVKEMTPFCEKSDLHNDSKGGVSDKQQVETIESSTQTALFDRRDESSSDNENSERYLANTSLLIVISAAIFILFFGSVELDSGRILMPMFWNLGSMWMSEPYSLFSITHEPPAVW